jgi:oligopeptide transport system substrate-binding protein
VPPGIPGYTPRQPKWAQWPRERRIAEARRLYAQAGYSTAHPLHVELSYNTQDDHRRIATLVAAMWRQYLGVETELVNQEWKVFVQERKQKRQTQVFRASWIGDFADASAFTDILRSYDGQNDEGYANPRFDALLEQARSQADPAARLALLGQAEDLLIADAPVLPIFFYRSKHLVKPYVQGWQDNVLDIHYSKDLRVLPH